MRVQQSNQVNLSFEYKHPLKTMWKKGKLPTVKIGLYNNVLSRDTISLEHELPRSLGGATSYSNLALTTKQSNNNRGTRPINEVLTPEMAKKYLDQFINVIVKEGKKIIFKGNKYIKQQKENLKNLGINI